MNALYAFWSRLQPGARISLGLGAALILALAVWVSVAALQPQYRVLFARLSEPDAASIVEQLKRQKMSYRLADDGTTIEVPAEQVHETRLRLMSSGIPLSGAVGFEIFDKQGLGATEQSQRVSYQRALQGELARTIGALEDVKQARVHLVLPESTLFKRDRQEARAAVSLVLKPGATLEREQILGIQRLVAASVAGLDAAKVVVTDQRGITLSRPQLSATADSGVPPEGRLEIKQQIEDYITRKVGRLLDSTYGPGQAIVSVDALLNFDEIHRTVQDVLPVHGGSSGGGGGLRHKRQIIGGAAGANLPAIESTDKETSGPSNSTTEVDYEYGRSIEQVIAAPGGITRLSIGVVIPGDLTPEKQQRITDLVRMAAGFNEARGDAIVVQPLDQLGGAKPLAARSDSAEVPAEESVAPAPATAVARDPQLRLSASRLPQAIWLVAVAAVVLIVLLLRRLSVPLLQHRPGAGAPLSEAQRQQLLLEIRQSLGESVSPELKARS